MNRPNRYQCPECGWIGTEEEMKSDYTGGENEMWSNWICPECGVWWQLDDYDKVEKGITMNTCKTCRHWIRAQSIMDECGECTYLRYGTITHTLASHAGCTSCGTQVFTHENFGCVHYAEGVFTISTIRPGKYNLMHQDGFIFTDIGLGDKNADALVQWLNMLWSKR